MDIGKACEMLAQKIPADRILTNELMKKHTSFRIGGPADILVLPHTTDDIRHAIVICNQLEIPFFIMGNGSNLLVRDKGIRGVVIKIADKFNDVDLNMTNQRVKAQAGILLSSLSKKTIENSMSGLEFASGIPGTLGGAITMNAGAYDGEMKDVVECAVVMDKNGDLYKLDKDQLKFEYRSSIIQEQGLIVLEAELQLKPGDYKESKAIVDDLTQRRKKKQPLSYPSAGSTFKRPTGYYAGKLIQDSGLKGMRVGDAQISELHAGFIINLGNASARDVIDLIEIATSRIMDKYGVEIHPEVKIIGQE